MVSRRAVLRAGALGTLTGLAGCLGTTPPACTDSQTVLHQVQSGYVVQLPRDDRHNAETVVATARDRGYAAYLAQGITFEPSPRDAAYYELTLTGDLTRSEVKNLLATHNVTAQSITSLDGSLVAAIRNPTHDGFASPWAPTVIERRTAFLETHHTAAGVPLPELAATNQYLTVTPAVPDQIPRLQHLYRPRGYGKFEIFGHTAATHTNRREINPDSIRITRNGDTCTVAFAFRDDGYAYASLLAEGEFRSQPFQHTVTFYLDGTKIYSRPLTDQERAKIRDAQHGQMTYAFNPVRLPNLPPETALRIAAALYQPSAAKVILTPHCQPTTTTTTTSSS